MLDVELSWTSDSVPVVAIGEGKLDRPLRGLCRIWCCALALGAALALDAIDIRLVWRANAAPSPASALSFWPSSPFGTALEAAAAMGGRPEADDRLGRLGAFSDRLPGFGV